MSPLSNEIIELTEHCLTRSQNERILAARERLAQGRFITFNELKKQRKKWKVI